MENPVLTSLMDKRKKTIDFILYIEKNLFKKNGTKIKIDFKSSRFNDEGFAILEMQGVEMNQIVRAIRSECLSQLEKMNKEIERYEKGLNT
jgi:hypothetical protein